MTSAPTKRSPRRQRLVAHLYACGARPVMEALLAVEAGEPLDGVLSNYSRHPADLFRTMGAAGPRPLATALHNRWRASSMSRLDPRTVARALGGEACG